ncbi:family X-type DNA polymerase [Cryptosporidium sp. chipmunk genotype I]|uniref:family X-type DNA polymerase n=1 Tax=Cryptosporidium sp. chipmunk genotype I TaxID=1280935 RepID=UPI00351A78A8|nr:family X-type DNA polymerase [Cryptosporidium sp. chipmunk genotype I]
MLNIQEFKKSKQLDYLYKDIADDFVNQFNDKMVPRVISLIDMDAFFAQVCHVEYNIPRDKPLAVIHNNVVLAVNYPSRQKGVNRRMSKEEILSICPEIIIPQNVFLDVRGQYLELFNDDSNQSITNDDMTYQKLSLDMFRKASKMIFSKLKSYLPTCNAQIASIDEIYFDLTEVIRKIFNSIKNYLSNQNDIETDFDFEKLKSETCINEVNTNLLFSLNTYNNCLFDFNSIIQVLFPELLDEKVMSNIINNDIINSKDSDNNINYYHLTFQEMCLIFGSILIYRARRRLEEETSYTCSSGIFINKIYSKMLSSLKKPNGQTVLLHRWFESYIEDTHILKLRFLGGKLGKCLIEKFPEIKTIKDLQKLSIKQLVDNFGEKNGLYLYNSSRGIDDDPVDNHNETNNSLQSSKIFGIPLRQFNQIENWLKIFSCELFYRNQNNYQISKRKPTKITVRMKCKDGIVKARTGDFIYNSDIPTKNDIYESCKSIILNKFGSNLFPCKFLGVSLNGYKLCSRNDDNSKIKFKTANIYQSNTNNLNKTFSSSKSLMEEDEYFQFDSALMDAIDEEIFGRSQDNSIKGLRLIYEDWPFVIGGKINKRKSKENPVKKNSKNDNQVKIKLSSNATSPNKLFNNKHVIPKLTQYKQTKLKFALPPVQISSPSQILVISQE